VVRDPLQKTPADVLVIARQQWLAAKDRLAQLKNLEPKNKKTKLHSDWVRQKNAAVKNVELTLINLGRAEEAFDNLYGGVA